MSVYVNGSNTQNIVPGAGLSATAHDDYGNSTLSVNLATVPPTTSAALRAAVTDETGTGVLVFNTAPNLVNPVVTFPETNLPNRFFTNFATAGQTPAATTRTYVTGSALGPFTAGTLAVGTILRWKFDLTKTAAGSASSTFDIAFGTAGTTADTAYVSFTKPSGTAAADQGWVEISAVVKTAGASGVVIGNFRLIHNLAATGHAQVPAVSVVTTSGTVNLATPTYAGICITTGASDAITINQVEAEAIGL